MKLHGKKGKKAEDSEVPGVAFGLFSPIKEFPSTVFFGTPDTGRHIVRLYLTK